ncbi:hypothetical protein EW146_g2649 [Bondarzewia mesenterica]|uniref:G-protein coupled receptors family 1 profile domain-containing protein n=1 Tax=Bondarzewia mesenterica TaxID=1095465 RepID=A0A4S4M0C0_9AGAM|nr:hypothetical protein EW146_g2649 [Bondarzewia mesenterica]
MPAIPPPPAGFNYIAVLKPALHSILIAHSFLVLFFPILFALIYFSTASTRRQHVFILNIITICLAISVGIMLDWRCVRLSLKPTKTYPISFNLAISLLGVIQSLLVDVILLIRLISVYPREVIGPSRFISMITLPILLKIGRFINLVMFIQVLADLAKGPNADLAVQQEWASAPYIKIEWFGQLIDVTYASTLFLYKIWLHRQGRKSIESGSDSKVSFSYRLKILFYIASTNFVVPVIFSLVQIIVLYKSVDTSVVNDIVLVSTNISVIGVVFASIWAGSWARREEMSIAHVPGPGMAPSASGSRTMQFALRSMTNPTSTYGTRASSTTPPSDANDSVPMFIISEKNQPGIKATESTTSVIDIVARPPDLPRL